MKKAERIVKVSEILEQYFPEPPIPLEHQDPFTLLIAVLLSAQCTDARVNQVTPALFARAPNAFAMAKLDVAEIFEFIRSCGLAPTKAKNIKALSERLVADWDGIVPKDIKLLEQLPGVGHKTASVVMTQAFQQPAFPVDTHILRVAKRWRLTRSENVKRVEADLKLAFARDAWGKVHLQMIYFGRRFCPARGHQVENCPMCCWAQYR